MNVSEQVVYKLLIEKPVGRNRPHRGIMCLLGQISIRRSSQTVQEGFVYTSRAKASSEGAKRRP